MATRLIAKLRYMGRQYSAGQVARGGEGQKHYLEEAADTLETQAACIAELEAKNAELTTVVVEKNLQINALTEVSRELANEKLVTESLRYQLSASQAREKALREAVTDACSHTTPTGYKILDTARNLPQDTAALDERENQQVVSGAMCVIQGRCLSGEQQQRIKELEQQQQQQQRDELLAKERERLAKNQVPEDCVVVPREPTRKMIDAALVGMPDGYYRAEYSRHLCARDYKVMIAAAPKEPT